MVQIDVLLSGRLKIDGYGRGRPMNDDTSFPLTVQDGSTVSDVISTMGVPQDKVTLTMINGHRCPVSTSIRSRDRVILIPRDVAALWGALHRQNLGMGIGLDR